jgi:hypothetical protein
MQAISLGLNAFEIKKLAITLLKKNNPKSCDADACS